MSQTQVLQKLQAESKLRLFLKKTMEKIEFNEDFSWIFSIWFFSKNFKWGREMLLKIYLRNHSVLFTCSE